MKFSGNRGHFLGTFFSGYGDRALMRIALGNLLAPVNNKSPEQMLSYALPILNPPLFNPLYLHRLWLVICSFEHMYTEPINHKESGSPRNGCCQLSTSSGHLDDLFHPRPLLDMAPTENGATRVFDA